jgi:hypothetical protein
MKFSLISIIFAILFAIVIASPMPGGDKENGQGGRPTASPETTAADYYDYEYECEYYEMEDSSESSSSSSKKD